MLERIQHFFAEIMPGEFRQANRVSFFGKLRHDVRVGQARGIDERSALNDRSISRLGAKIVFRFGPFVDGDGFDGEGTFASLPKSEKQYEN